MRGRRLSWLLGGIGLIVCGVVGVIRGSAAGALGTGTFLTVLSDLLWASSILLVSIGLSREGSVVARKPFGLVACGVVALWPLTVTFVRVIASNSVAERSGAWQLWDYLMLLVPAVAGLGAATEIARTHVVPSPWNWAAAWVLGFQVVVWVAPQLVNAASPMGFVELASVFSTLGTLGFLTTTLGLGILAVVLSSRSYGVTVPVFRSSDSEK